MAGFESLFNGGHNEGKDVKNVNENRMGKLAFVLLVALLVPLEIFCAYLAFDTLGEVVSTLYFIAIGLNLIFVVLAFRSRTLATLGLLLLAMAIIPYQLYLGNRLLRVQDEAGRIVAYVYEVRVDTGEFPPTLAGYEFHDPEIEQFIRSYRVEQDGSEFSLFYRVGTEDTSHHFMSQSGWGYYPD